MKYKYLSLVLLSSAIVALSGCATMQDNTTKALPYLRPAAGLAAGGALVAAKADQRYKMAAYIDGVAHGIRTLMDGTVPSTEQVRLVVRQFTPESQHYEVFGNSLVAIYTSTYPYVRDDYALAAKVLELIASGCQDAAAPYLTK